MHGEPIRPQPKDRPVFLDKRERANDLRKRDEEEKQKCHQRSGRQCEVIVGWSRCHRWAMENHHLLGGIGRRNRGRSILAEHRLDICIVCHRAINARTLVPSVTKAEAEWAHTVRYRRVK